MKQSLQLLFHMTYCICEWHNYI